MTIEAIKAMYAAPHYARGLCMEREWSADGETELALYPYTRVRIVPVYDAMHWIETHEHVQTGLTVEVW